VLDFNSYSDLPAVFLSPLLSSLMKNEQLQMKQGLSRRYWCIMSSA